MHWNLRTPRKMRRLIMELFQSLQFWKLNDVFVNEDAGDTLNAIPEHGAKGYRLPRLQGVVQKAAELRRLWSPSTHQLIEDNEDGLEELLVLVVEVGNTGREEIPWMSALAAYQCFLSHQQKGAAALKHLK